MPKAKHTHTVHSHKEHPELNIMIKDLPRDTPEQEAKYAQLLERAKLMGFDVLHTEAEIAKAEKK